ncbi:hypothetical protein ACGFZH_08935 [Streptomyces zaomyceticus]|uniref:hypothetical protein n=1 Tax=Streptomyces zaomyceticus TaxID=68286 RepID=UPI0037126452
MNTCRAPLPRAAVAGSGTGKAAAIRPVAILAGGQLRAARGRFEHNLDDRISV